MKDSAITLWRQNIVCCTWIIFRSASNRERVIAETVNLPVLNLTVTPGYIRLHVLNIQIFRLQINVSLLCATVVNLYLGFSYIVVCYWFVTVGFCWDGFASHCFVCIINYSRLLKILVSAVRFCPWAPCHTWSSVKSGFSSSTSGQCGVNVEPENTPIRSDFLHPRVKARRVDFEFVRFNAR